MDNNFRIIKEIVEQVLPACRVVLFGSRARKDHDIESDYDLLLIIEYDIDMKSKRVLNAEIRTKLAKHKIPVDIIIQSNRELEIKKLTTGHIVKQALAEGINL